MRIYYAPGVTDREWKGRWKEKREDGSCRPQGGSNDVFLLLFLPGSAVVGSEIELLDLADQRIARVGAGALVIECLD